MRRVAPALAAASLGAATFDTARRGAAFVPAGGSLAAVMVGVAAGWALVAASWVPIPWPAPARPSLAAVPSLLAAAGCAWLAGGLGWPGARSGEEFTLGLLAATAAPAFAGHAALLLASAPGRLLPAALYVTLVLLAGLLPALTLDAVCTGCPHSAVAVVNAPGLAADLLRWGLRLGLLAVACTVAVTAWRFAHAPAAQRRRVAPVVVPSCAYLVLVAAALVHAWPRGYVASGRVEARLWLAQALALLAVGAGAAWLAFAARRRRSQLADLVIELARTPRSGGLAAALAAQLEDPGLELLYPHPDGGWIDASGSTREPRAVSTPLVNGGDVVALVCHREDLQLGDVERVVRLGLEHERLQAELRHRLASLRRSRADVVAAGESERRRLERDLHDGAQQRLVALAFAVGLGYRGAPAQQVNGLRRAQTELYSALAELRELAHGLYPVALADGGLSAAIESLSDRRAGLHGGLPLSRYSPAIEEAAYHAIASLADHWIAAPISITAAEDTTRLLIELRAGAAPPADVVAIEDRVGALGGSVAVTGVDGDSVVRLELPCA